MPMISKLLYQRHIPINDDVSIYVPTVGEVLDNEANYYSLVAIFSAMPIDFMVQLDDAGIDFTTINEYELFLLLFPGLKTQDTHLILGDLDLSKFEMGVNEQNGDVALINRESGVIIDRAIHSQIADNIRKLHHFEKDIRKPANEEAKKFLIKRARDKLRRKKSRKEDSQLETLIVAMVNTEQFKYNYETVRDITIYQFNESVRQIVSKVDYEHRMHGVYAGTVSVKDLSQDDLTWLSHK